MNEKQAQAQRDAVKRYRESAHGAAKRLEYMAQYMASDRGDERRRRAAVATAKWRAVGDQGKAANAITVANSRAQSYGVKGLLVTADVLALWERQPVCVRCGNGKGLDHIVPLRAGGVNQSSNLQNLCRSCNARKSRVEDRYLY